MDYMFFLLQKVDKYVICASWPRASCSLHQVADSRVPKLIFSRVEMIPALSFPAFTYVWSGVLNTHMSIENLCYILLHAFLPNIVSWNYWHHDTF